MAFKLVDLPYARAALAPHMSGETLDLHHGKHHRGYVDKVNQAVEEMGLEGGSLTEVIRSAHARRDIELFNNSAQTWNHNFFWKCLSAPDDRRATGRLAALIEEGFGSTDVMLARLKAEAVGHFSNGWAWLVLDRDRLAILSLHDADTPVVRDGIKPLLTLDLWEHAYYLDYRNERPKFVDALLGNLVDWEFVARNLDGDGIARADQEADAKTPELAG